VWMLWKNGFRVQAQVGGVCVQMNGNGTVSEQTATNGALPAKTKKAGLKSSKGFGGFFKIGSGKKSEKGAVGREGEPCLFVSLYNQRSA